LKPGESTWGDVFYRAQEPHAVEGVCKFANLTLHILKVTKFGLNRSMAGQKNYLTEGEVEADYGLRVRFLRKRRVFGNGPVFVKISGELGRRGGRILYPREGVESWLASRPRGGGEAAGR
jgi:hypothetical protein